MGGTILKGWGMRYDYVGMVNDCEKEKESDRGSGDVGLGRSI